MYFTHNYIVDAIPLLMSTNRVLMSASRDTVGGKLGLVRFYALSTLISLFFVDVNDQSVDTNGQLEFRLID